MVTYENVSPSTIEAKEEFLQNMLMWNEVCEIHGGRKYTKKEINALKRCISRMKKQL